jgi:hypothetical protein
MRWVFAGYAFGVYALFAVLAAVRLPAHHDPASGAWAHLVAIPGLTILFGAEVFIHGTADERAHVKAAMASESMRRREPLAAGMIGAVLALAACYAVYRTNGLWTDSLALGFIAILLILVIAPAASCGWLVARAKQLAKKPAGFPVLLAMDTAIPGARPLAGEYPAPPEQGATR